MLYGGREQKSEEIRHIQGNVAIGKKKNQKEKLTEDWGGEGAYPFCSSVDGKVFWDLLELRPSICYLL